jgi:hypothetical protein
MAAREKRRSDEPDPEMPETDGIQVDESTETPGEKRAGRPEDPRVKATYSIPRSLKKLIDSVSSELGIEACDLVEQVVREALKGCSKPTVNPGLRNAIRPVIRRKKKSAT